MERVRRLMRIWPYLPAFRAVAETQHLPTASEHLFVSPSALSRSIKLLEEDVEVALFDRVGRHLELNAAGQHLLSAVRDAMRLADEGISQVTAQQLVGPVRVSAPPPWRSEVVVPALDALREEHPDLVPVVTEVEPSSVPSALLRGRIDVALVADLEPNPDLTARLLAELPQQIFCGPGHPLHGKRAPRLTDDLEHAAPDRFEGDPWPAHLPRKVGLRADLESRLELCAAGRYVTVLPRAWAARAPGLRAVSGPELGPLRLFGCTRRSLGIPGRADAALDALEAALAGVS